MLQSNCWFVGHRYDAYWAHKGSVCFWKCLRCGHIAEHAGNKKRAKENCNS